MPDAQQIAESISRHLVDARSEIALLEVALRALTAVEGQRSRPPARRAPAAAAEKRRPVVTRQPKTKPAPGKASARRAQPKALADGALEELLAAAPDGLSARALTTATGASYAKVTARLRELQHADHVRSFGSRRTSVWRLVTDEMRIAERAADLEKRQAPAAPVVA